MAIRSSPQQMLLKSVSLQTNGSALPPNQAASQATRIPDPPGSPCKATRGPGAGLRRGERHPAGGHSGPPQAELGEASASACQPIRLVAAIRPARIASSWGNNFAIPCFRKHSGLIL
jgi:hypothetical protein